MRADYTKQNIDIFIYTVSPKKLGHFYFYDTLGKYGPISIILSLLNS